jgi:hypothetical protein
MTMGLEACVNWRLSRVEVSGETVTPDALAVPETGPVAVTL